MDLIDKIIELTDLFDDNVVTTADKIPQPEPKKEVVDREAINEFMKRNPMAGGGMLVQPGFGGVRQGYKKSVSKSAFRKPYAPEIEKRIIELANNDKLGAQAIANELGLNRSSVGKRITALKKEGKIKNIPVKEKAASIAMRGDLYGKSPAEKYLKIREIRDVDRKAIDRSTGKLLFNIPKNAKFKVNFGNTGARFADITNIPEEFIGVQYFKTKAEAEKALAKRKKLKLIGDEDPDPIRKKANKKKYDLIKEVSDNNIERVLADFKKGQPLESAHRLSLNQVRKTGEMYNVMNLGLDFDDPNYVQINNEAVKPFENKLKQLYAEQNKLYKQAINLKTIPQDLRKKIEFNNLKISTVVDLAGGRVQGLQLDEFTLKPKVTGVNYANVLGFGLYDKPVKDLTKIDRAEIGAIMQGQIENEKKTAGKTAQKLFENKKLLKNVDQLATKSFVPTKKVVSDGPTLGMNLGFLKGFGEAIKAVPTPTGTALLTGALGVDPTSAIDRASIGAEAALAPQLVKQVSKITSNPIYQRFLNLGLSPTAAMRVARVASPIGLASLIGEATVKGAKDTMAAAKQIDAIQDQDLQRQEYDNLIRNIVGYAGGGIAKLAGDSSGPPPEAGPNSQGLSSLMKRGTNI
jgi:biotin operon repressor